MTRTVWRESADSERLERLLRPAFGALRVAIVGIGDATAGWAALVGGAIVAGLLFVAGLQLLLLSALSDGRPLAVEALTVVFVGLIAVVCIAFLALTFWRTRDEPEDVERHVLAGLSLATVAGTCVVAFAGVTWLLWDRGVLHRAGSPTLWRVEELYVWHLADAVPFLGIPQSLRWEQPTGFDDHVSGSLVLAFKLVVILPLLRVALVVLRLAIDGWLVVQQGFLQATLVLRTSHGRAAGSSRSYAHVAWRLCGGSAIWATLGGLAFAFVLDPSSAAAHAIARLPDQVTVAGDDYSLLWVSAVPAFVIGAFVFAGLAVAPIGIGLVSVAPGERAAAVWGTLTLYVLALVLLTEAAAAASIGFLQLGIADTAQPLAAAGQIRAAVSFHVWHALDAVPGLAIPDTLNWSLGHEFIDRWSGGTLLVYKLVFVAILTVPIGRAVRAFFLRLRLRRSAARSALVDVEAFAAGLGTAVARLDEATQLVPHETRSYGEASRLLEAAAEELWLLRRRRAAVTSALGEAAIGTAAADAITALDAWGASLRKGLLFELTDPFGLRAGDLLDPGTAAAAAHAAVDAYARAAESALTAHLARISPTGEPAGAG